MLGALTLYDLCWAFLAAVLAFGIIQYYKIAILHAFWMVPVFWFCLHFAPVIFKVGCWLILLFVVLNFAYAILKELSK